MDIMKNLKFSAIRNQYGTFIIDSLILLPWFFGPLAVFLTVRYIYRRLGRKKWIIPSLFGLIILGFWLIAGGLYFDVELAAKPVWHQFGK